MMLAKSKHARRVAARSPAQARAAQAVGASSTIADRRGKATLGALVIVFREVIKAWLIVGVVRAVTRGLARSRLAIATALISALAAWAALFLPQEGVLPMLSGTASNISAILSEHEPVRAGAAYADRPFRPVLRLRGDARDHPPAEQDGRIVPGGRGRGARCGLRKARSQTCAFRLQVTNSTVGSTVNALCRREISRRQRPPG
jgi:hypothetical protein